MIDHVYISVTDVHASAAFYTAALAPLGWRSIGTYDSSSGPAEDPDLYGLGDPDYQASHHGNSIWLRRRRTAENEFYLGLRCDSNAQVDAAYRAAREAGGVDEGAPAYREYFGPGYYAANVADPDGNRLEFVHKA